jgi:hypothetical protein
MNVYTLLDALKSIAIIAFVVAVLFFDKAF